MSFPQFERAITAVVAVQALLIGGGCGDSTGVRTGAVRVTVTSTGAALDPNGYTVAVDGGVGQTIPVNGTMLLSGLSPGSHTILLGHLTPDCAVGPDNPRSVTVGPGVTLQVGFLVACGATTGILRLGLWDYTQRIIDPTGASCADTGTFMLTQVGSSLAGWSEQTGGSSNGSGLGICNTTRLADLPPALWSIFRVMWDTLTNGSVEGTAVRFTTGWVACQYAGSLLGRLADEMSGSVTCNSGIGTASGTWHARYHQPVGTVSIMPTRLPALIPGTELGWFDAAVTDTGGRRIFGRPVSWTSDNPAVATIKPAVGTIGMFADRNVVMGASQGVTSIRGTVEESSGATPLSVGPVRFVAVLAGALESWGLSTAGTLYRWPGVGLVLDANSLLPSPVTDGLVYTSVSVGSYMNFEYNTYGLNTPCAITATGTTYCVTGSLSGTVGTALVSGSGVPQFTAVTVGLNHACGLTAEGSAYCWGENGVGQLGDGSLTRTEAPRLVAGDLRFTSLSAGIAYTCGVTAGGAAYCWGANDSGQLGDGSATNRSTPTPVEGGLFLTSVSAGRYHTCGVTASGAAYCWGWNGSANLGDGSTTDRPTPVAVVGNLTFASISVSGAAFYPFDAPPAPPVAYSCGVTTTNVALCWGDNTFGQLGTGSTAGASTPVLVAGGLAFATVSAGPDHACGLTTAGIAYCWGNNGTGALGNNSRLSSPVPVWVAGQP
jgi:regulator of chromosome condensation (RCC1) repeat-containing protein/Regulator of Chromosome Condensation (RCC1) repeat protein